MNIDVRKHMLRSRGQIAKRKTAALVIILQYVQKAREEMKFKFNDMEYEITEVSEEELKDEYLKDHPNEKREEIFLYGRTSYTQHTIKICKELCKEEKIRTLKHELCHCWLWNTANSCHQEYNEEHICEIVACSNNFINEVVEKYINEY